MFTYIIYIRMNYKGESDKFKGDFLFLDIKNESQFFKAKNDMICYKEYNLFVFDYVRSKIYTDAFDKLGNISHPENVLNQLGGDIYWLNRISGDLKNYIVTFVFLPYEDKDIFKAKFGGKWCAKAKSWYFVGDKYEQIHEYCKENNKTWEFEYNAFPSTLWDYMHNNKTYNEQNKNKLKSKTDIKSKPETKSKPKYDHINFDSDSD